MDFGQIIKKAWAITWRYRFLWVLGFFAGITGAGGGGGGNFGSGRGFGSGSSSSSGSSPSPFTPGGIQQFTSTLERWIPVIIALAVIWILVGLLLWALSLAARGGLIWAVNELEEGRKPPLGSAWSVGFSHIWSVLGLGLLLQLPVLVAIALLAAAIGVPIALAIARGGRFAAAAIVPVCGSLAIGIPLVLVMGFVLGIMYVIGLRRIVLDGIGAIQSAKDAWRTFRARFKDTALMWLINWGLNIAAGLAVAVPIVIVTVVLAIPAIIALTSKHWGIAIVLGGIWLLILFVISLLYAAIWGTFTSALWTILYRRLTGREPVAPPSGHMPPAYAQPAVAPGYPAPGYPAPGYPAPGGPPAPTAPPSGYGAPPVAGWAPPPPSATGWSPDSSPTAPPRGPAQDPYSPPTGAPRPPLDPYRDSPGPRQPLDPYTPWVPGAPTPQQPPHE